MYSRHICGGSMTCESEEITLRIDIYASLAGFNRARSLQDNGFGD
jgi:hypothetical protein